jgi:ribosomal-protein-alanine N-acetyltransferase
MTHRDIDGVLSIEQTVFRHPWSRDFFQLILSDMNNYLVTLKNESGIIGYGGYHLLRRGANFLAAEIDYRRVIHLINIAIVPPMQRMGLGTYLLNTLMSNARGDTAEYCYLEVRPSNERAYGFYLKRGFRMIGIIENYYPQESENALVMGRKLKETQLG